MRLLRALLASRSGATAVEFALVLAPLVLLLAGSLEVGRLLWTQHVLSEAAIAGARCMGIRAPDCATGDALDLQKARLYVQQEARAFAVVVAPSAIAVTADAGCPTPTGFARVRIVHPFASALPLLDGRDLAAEACFPNQ